MQYGTGTAETATIALTEPKCIPVPDSVSEPDFDPDQT